MPSTLVSPPASTPAGLPAEPPSAHRRPPNEPARPGERSLALDAYRGLIMFLLVSHGFGFSAWKKHPVGKYFAMQVDHVAWEGLVLWDLIQPAFMFMVGVAMPFAFAKRQAEGESLATGLWHVLRRCATLIFLSQLFVAVQSRPGEFRFGLINVLSQIAFAYLICYLLMRLDWRNQVAAAAGLLGAHWMLFLLYPGPDGPFSQTGNVGQAIDHWLLGRNYTGLYVTINFLSSSVTTLFGVWAGMLMRQSRPLAEKLRILLWWACGCLIGGMLLATVNPMVKRIWTASFTIYSAGFVLLGLAAMIWLVDGRGWRRGVWPLAVVGTNSIFIYCLSQLARGGVTRAVEVFSYNGFAWLGPMAGPVARDCAILGVMWWMCWWLYKRQIFIKV